MAKLRLQFAKEGPAAYMSHLDLLRTFQRVFLRTGFIVRHSQGYHPHPILSFPLPLPVGQESVCELLDFELDGEPDAAALPEKLAPGCPEGLRPLRCRSDPRPAGELALLKARVTLVYDGGVPDGAAEAIGSLLARESVAVQKKTRRGEPSDVDLRPLLRSLEIGEEPGLLLLTAVAAAQNPGMNPALLVSAVEKYLPALAPDFSRVKRLAMLDREGNEFF